MPFHNFSLPQNLGMVLLYLVVDFLLSNKRIKQSLDFLYILYKYTIKQLYTEEQYCIFVTVVRCVCFCYIYSDYFLLIIGCLTGSIMTTSDLLVRYSCLQCNKSYVHLRSLRKHEKFECGKVPQFQCTICLKCFHQKGNLKTHYGTKHCV